ncbi:MAG: hypothetical protein LC754_05760, partial [Acidobacteria bacterium]|nr:hypothetical protein [Acidobacteriota bacterium]
MKQYKNHAVVFVAAVVLLVAFAALAARPGFGQSQTMQKISDGDSAVTNVQPTAIVRERRANATLPEASPAATATIFSAAATRNAFLKNDLSWVFGGKPQRGWNLYTPLISRLLDNDNGADTNDFASALANW